MQNILLYRVGQNNLCKIYYYTGLDKIIYAKYIIIPGWTK